jgi:hypothetical protein
MELPKTLEDWAEFMNGYRDPKTTAARRQELQDQGEFERFVNMDFGSGSGARECGHRKEGGTYATCGLSPYGMPLEHFVTCSPVPINADDFNLANVGVKLVDIEEPCEKCKGVKPTKSVKARYFTDVCSVCNGTGTETVTHVFDIVGKEYYPNVADFLEEARRMGVSRRLELEDARQYARLSRRSRLMLLHHKAVINNPLPRVKDMGFTESVRLMRAACPKELHELTGVDKKGALRPHGYYSAPAPGCSSLHWHMIEGGENIPETLAVPQGGQTPKSHQPLEIPSFGFVQRDLKSGSYRGYAMPEGYTPEFSLGIFAVFPLTKIQVVDPDGEYEDRVDRAGNARLDVERVEC